MVCAMQTHTHTHMRHADESNVVSIIIFVYRRCCCRCCCLRRLHLRITKVATIAHLIKLIRMRLEKRLTTWYPIYWVVDQGEKWLWNEYAYAVYQIFSVKLKVLRPNNQMTNKSARQRVRGKIEFMCEWNMRWPHVVSKPHPHYSVWQELGSEQSASMA